MRDIFSSVDYFFAKKIYGEKEDNVFFALCFLFAVSKIGHLCVKIKEGKLYPKIEDIISFYDGVDYAFLEKKIKEGLEAIPNEILEKPSTFDYIPTKPLCLYKNSFYLQRNYVFERSVYKNFSAFLESSPFISFTKDEVEKTLVEKKELLLEQKESIRKVLFNAVSFIFGGPGTGKTFTATCLMEVISSIFSKPFKVVIAAPTGKAAMDLKMKILKGNFLSSISLKAGTLHFLLKNQKVIDADLVIVDEASMMDVKIMSLFFEKLKKGSRIVLIGDQNQLPPVESGNLFSVFFENRDKFPGTSVLKRCMRFDKSEMHLLSDIIKSGNKEKFLNYVSSERKENSGVHFKSIGNDRAVYRDLLKYVDDNLGNIKDFEKPEALLSYFNNFKILTPLKQGKFGFKTLNNLIYRHLLSKTVDGFFAYPIIITKNDYKLNLFNGFLGVVIQKKGRSVAYFFSEEEEGNISIKKFPVCLLSSFEPAYCLSVHKSQGSEFNNIFLLLPQGSEVFGREMLYTAVTRSKNQLNMLFYPETTTKIIGKKTILQNNFF